MLVDITLEIVQISMKHIVTIIHDYIGRKELSIFLQILIDVV